MNRSARTILVACLIALHSAVSVGGAGLLHALPGLGHRSGLTPLAKHDHSHGPGKSSHEAADECALCHFIVQGQLSTDAVAGPTARLAVALASPEAPPVDLTPSPGPSAPRGPPSA